MNNIFKSIGIVPILFTLAAAGPLDLAGQEPQVSQAPSLVLPQVPGLWINSAPVSIDMLRGKSIVLYFYEEDCPRCREKWPAILAAKQQLQGQPVLLIGVNSGNSPAEVGRYVRENRITIPVIVDTNRSLERAAGLNEISLRNIYQAVVIDPQGQMRVGGARDLPVTLQSAAAAASWNVDPAAIPASLMALWQQIEFGNYAGTAKILNRRLADRNPEVKAAAESLHAYVQQQIQKLVEQADAAMEADDKWQAYQTYQRLATELAGYELPDTLQGTLAGLADDEHVLKQIEGMKQWQLAVKYMAGANPARNRLNTMLTRIVDRYPGTQAASLADQASASAGL